jgi:hypothetical protein
MLFLVCAFRPGVHTFFTKMGCILLHTMSTPDRLEQQFRDIRRQQIADYQEKISADKRQQGRLQKTANERQQWQQEILRKIGLNLEQLEPEQTKQQEELKSYLEQMKPSVILRPSAQARDTKAYAVLAESHGKAAHLVLPPYASTLFSADAGVFEGVDGEGEITNGWVSPSSSSHIKFETHWSGAGSFAPPEAWSTPLQYSVYFTFTPAKTASYSMTAVLAFHAFYILRADDGLFTSKFAKVFLSVVMNVHQYVDIGSKSFPALIDEEHDNADEVITFDRTSFFDYTTILKEGDPVTVTVTVLPRVQAYGWGSYSELNFKDGIANYIQPLFLSLALA